MGDWPEVDAEGGEVYDEDHRGSSLEDMRPPSYDSATGQVLDPKAVTAGRQEEIEYMNRLKVWEARPIDECLRNTGKKPIGTRWTETDKGDYNNPLVRCRLVVQETKTKTTATQTRGRIMTTSQLTFLSWFANTRHWRSIKRSGSA